MNKEKGEWTGAEGRRRTRSSCSSSASNDERETQRRVKVRTVKKSNNNNAKDRERKESAEHVVRPQPKVREGKTSPAAGFRDKRSPQRASCIGTTSKSTKSDGAAAGGGDRLKDTTVVVLSSSGCETDPLRQFRIPKKVKKSKEEVTKSVGSNNMRDQAKSKPSKEGSSVDQVRDADKGGMGVCSRPKGGGSKLVTDSGVPSSGMSSRSGSGKGSIATTISPGSTGSQSRPKAPLQARRRLGSGSGVSNAMTPSPTVSAKVNPTLRSPAAVRVKPIVTTHAYSLAENRNEIADTEDDLNEAMDWENPVRAVIYLRCTSC
jgi:hypothetical protein